MSEEQVTSSVQDRYAPQFAEELARNEQEQKELEERLRQLREDHRALTGLLAALQHETAPRNEEAAAPESVTGEAKAPVDAVPEQRRTRKKEAASNGAAPKRAKKPAKQGSAKASVLKATATEEAVQDKAATDTVEAAEAPATDATKAAVVGKAAKKPAAAAPRGRTGRTLQDVIAGLLAGHFPERRTVREIFDELKQKHPERASSTQSVRNALNGLLRKGAIEREEKQGAVWFGATNGSSATPTAAEAKAAEAVTERSEQSEEKAAADATAPDRP